MDNTNTTQGIDLDRLEVIATLLRKRGSFAISGELAEMIALARQQTPVTGETQNLPPEVIFHNGKCYAPYPATHQATLAAPAEDCRSLTMAECETALRWLDVTRLYAFAEPDDEALEAKLRAAPASPPKPAASQQAVANSEQQEKVAPPPRGTGSQHDASALDVSKVVSVLRKNRKPKQGSAHESVVVTFGLMGINAADKFHREFSEIVWRDHASSLSRKCDQSLLAGAAKGGANNDNSKNVATTAAADKGD